MLKFKTSCAVLANLSSNLLNAVGLSLFRYFEVGLRVCYIVVNKYVRYLIFWWVLVHSVWLLLFWEPMTSELRKNSSAAGSDGPRMTLFIRLLTCNSTKTRIASYRIYRGDISADFITRESHRLFSDAQQPNIWWICEVRRMRWFDY